MEKELTIEHILFNKQIQSNWDSYVFNHTHGSVFHHSGWLKALEAENGQPVTCLIGKDASGTLRGIMPLLFTRGIPFNLGKAAGCGRVSSLPRTPHCGPLADSQSGAQQLLDTAVTLLSQKSNLLQCKSLDATHELTNETLQKVVWRETFVKKIPSSPVPLTFGDSRNNRRITTSVRKAERLGVLVREVVDRGEVAVWHDLYLKTMQQHVIPARSIRFFLKLWDELQAAGILRLFGAYKLDGKKLKMVAGSLFLTYKESGYYAFNGCSSQGKLTRANDLLMWYFFRFAQDRNLACVDLGEVSEDNVGLAAFKRKWGVEKRPIYHYYFPPLKQHPEVNKKSCMHRIVAEAWKKLPAPIAARIGYEVNCYL